MTPTDLHAALAAVADAAPVPPVDRHGVERQVRRTRRRRRTAGLAVAGSIAAVTIGVSVVSRPDEPPVTSLATPADVVPVLLDGELTLVTGDAAEPTGLRLQRLLGAGHNGVVGTGPDGDLVVAQVTDDGLGSVRSLGEGPVRSAAVSADGAAVAWVDEARTLHLRGAATGQWSFDEATQTGFTGTLLATDGVDWVVRRDGGVYLERPQSARQPIRVAGAGTASATIDDGTVSLLADDGRVRLYDAGSGEPRGSGAARDPGTLAVWSSGSQTYEVVTQEASGRTLWSCATGGDCERQLDDPTGTLQLPGQE